VRKGPVSSRVALLLRSAEGKPFFASISQYSRSLPQCRVVTNWYPAGSLQRQRPYPPARLGRIFRAEGVPTSLPGQASRGRAEAAGRRRISSRAGGARGGARLPWRKRRARRLGRLPGRKILVMSLLALEEDGPSVLACPGGGFGGAVLACPGGGWPERPCLPWRRVWGAVLACPGGGWLERPCLPWRRVWGASLACPGGGFGVRFLLALEEEGLCVLACPGEGSLGESGSKPCLPWRRVARASLLARDESFGRSYLALFQGKHGLCVR
jgi:hypothetical protein